MATSTYKMESGVQLLARLQKKRDLENFYPILFENGPKPCEVVEVFSEKSPSCFLIDLITQALIPAQLGGVEASVLIFNTDGNLNYDQVIEVLRKKISLYASKLHANELTEAELNNMLHKSVSNLFLVEIYDAIQLYTSLQSLDSILVDKNISLVVFDTLTAFYWSEQSSRIIKMDIYLKNLLKMIQKITKEYKIILLYTRPEYFSSSKKSIEYLEECSDQPALEQVNYRIQLVCNDDGSYQVNVKTFYNFTKKYFKIIQDLLNWL